jgi:hypothetical protein
VKTAFTWKLLEVGPGAVLLAHYPKGSLQPPHLDNKCSSDADSGIRITCAYHLKSNRHSNVNDHHYDISHTYSDTYEDSDDESGIDTTESTTLDHHSESPTAAIFSPIDSSISKSIIPVLDDQ